MMVDNKALDSLAYELEWCDQSPNATLIIRNIDVPVSLIESVMLSFFYPENVLLGEKYGKHQKAPYTSGVPSLFLNTRL